MFSFYISRYVVILFWLAILAIFLIIYFYYPSIFNQMQQTNYQNTPYVDVPRYPP